MTEGNEQPKGQCMDVLKAKNAANAWALVLGKLCISNNSNSFF